MPLTYARRAILSCGLANTSIFTILKLVSRIYFILAMKKNLFFFSFCLLFLIMQSERASGQSAMAFYPAQSHPIPGGVEFSYTTRPNNGNSVANEACVGSTSTKLLLQVSYFNNKPNRLIYTKVGGGTDTLDMSSAQDDRNTVSWYNVYFTWIDVPSNAATGTWIAQRVNGGTVAERAYFTMTVNRPVVTLTALPKFICSSDTIALKGEPSSGVSGTGRFWLGTTLASPVNNSPHIVVPSGSFANNSNISHMFVPTLISGGSRTYYTGNSTDQPLYLSYEFTPVLSNSNIVCPAILSNVEESRVYNNQLELITFSPVSNAVDSILLNSKIERLLPAGGVISNQLLSYRGNHISTNGMFYPSAAGNGQHSIIVTLSNNNKCFAFDTTTIEVTNSFNVTGLDSSMCRLDTSVSLTPSLPYSKDSSFNYANGNNYKYVNEYNLFNLSALTTSGTPLPAVITAINAAPGHENFKFNPSLVAGDSLWVSIQYSVMQHVYITTNGVDSLISTSITPTVRDTKTIYLRGKPMVSFARVNNYYCESHNLINLAVYPTGNRAFGVSQ